MGGVGIGILVPHTHPVGAEANRKGPCVLSKGSHLQSSLGQDGNRLTGHKGVPSPHNYSGLGKDISFFTLISLCALDTVQQCSPRCQLRVGCEGAGWGTCPG